MKKVLMVARAFPPFHPVGHSIRVVKFVKYLPALGWLPVVLTIDDQKEYENTHKVGSAILLNEIQPDVKVYRTTAGEPSLGSLEKAMAFGRLNWLTRMVVKVLGGARRWSFRNLLLPDRSLVWLPFAVRQGRQIVRSEGIDVIFVTCPPHSAALVGVVLKLLTGKPLVLDFRDDWIDTPWYWSKSAIRRWIERRLESWVVKTADKVVLVTEWSKNAFLERYPNRPRAKFVMISNGCDLEEFAALNSTTTPLRDSRFTILHAGSLNDMKPWKRSLSGLFQAVQHILQQQPELAEKLTLVLAGAYPEEHRRLAEGMGLSSVIRELGHIPHQKALRLVKAADLLLAINYEGWSTLIPAKIYEYWAAGGPPILLLSCPGAAAGLVERHSLGFTVAPSDAAGIEQVIMAVYRQSRTAMPLRTSTEGIDEYDRRALTRRLAQVLSTAIGHESSR